jgi:hypothetical protein
MLEREEFESQLFKVASKKIALFIELCTGTVWDPGDER